MSKILLVDDIKLVRLSIEKIVTDNGHIVVGQAENGIKAIKEYKRKKPDLVLMDMTMPVMNGIQAVKEIKKIDPLAKVIMYATRGTENIVMEAIKSGACNFILKPFKEEKLLEVISNIII